MLRTRYASSTDDGFIDKTMTPQALAMAAGAALIARAMPDSKDAAAFVEQARLPLS